jgi:penicillin amidase
VVSGEIQLDGLDGPVDIFRDEFGVPHIYASTSRDLFFAQGYVHAQDRFWQMDFWRHIGSGRLSEMFGESQLDTDKFLRTMGWARVAEAELAVLDPVSIAILDDYAEGVNAYLADHQGSALSLEYAVLKLLNSDYAPEPWEPIHSLTWAKAMAWNLGGNMDGEIERANLLKVLTPEQLEQIVPPYPADHPYIVPEPNEEIGSLNTEGRNQFVDLDSLMAIITAKGDRLEALLGPRGSGIGSNSWTISGELTNTGKPLLANDTHLGEQMPSIWYEIGLHCTPQGEACPYNVTGYSFAGDPGVIIGHNDRIAWGFTNLGPDVQDLYIERINPENPNQYEVNGEWVNMDLINETIMVAGSDPVELTVRYTRHGPIISDTYGPLEGFTETSGVKLPSQYAIALRWTALENGQTFPAIWKINLAGNWDEFRQAASLFDAPSQNFLYADVDGNIGYQTPGKIPVRANGDGTLPVPGWMDEYEWQGYIPFEELPYAYNPPQKYIVTANNAVVGPDYPYLLTSTWNYGFRAQSIVDKVEGAQDPIDISYLQAMQGDNRDMNAETLLPILLELPLSDTHLEEARMILQDWDYQADMDSAPAALFEAFWMHVLVETFHDDLPEESWPDGDSRWFEVMRNLVQDPQSAWWDDQSTTQTVETRDDIFLRAFIAGVKELEEVWGNDPEKWAWGDLHTVTFHNQSLGESGVGPIEAIFNRGPYRTAGGSSIINATSWDASETFNVSWLPSQRMIVDLDDLGNSLSIHTTGQSGHAYHPHYVDMANLWRTIQYHPMLWDRDDVETGAEGHLRLAP